MYKIWKPLEENWNFIRLKQQRLLKAPGIKKIHKGAFMHPKISQTRFLLIQAKKLIKRRTSLEIWHQVMLLIDKKERRPDLLEYLRPMRVSIFWNILIQWKQLMDIKTVNLDQAPVIEVLIKGTRKRENFILLEAVRCWISKTSCRLHTWIFRTTV